VLLLQASCIEITCLRAASQYNCADPALVLPDGFKVIEAKLSPRTSINLLLEPVFAFANNISRLPMDKIEIALLAAIVFMHSGESSSVTKRLRRRRPSHLL